jgi:hypothetical protein
MLAEVHAEPPQSDEDVPHLPLQAQVEGCCARGGVAVLRDKYGQCIGCFFDPCRCFGGGKETRDECSQCSMVRNEVAALRSELKRVTALLEIEKDRRFGLEKDLLSTRTLTPPPFRGGRA